MGGEDQPIELEDWTKSYCIARYGSYSEAVEGAWDLFRNTAYSSLYSYPRFTWQTVVPDQRRISKIDVSPDFLKGVE